MRSRHRFKSRPAGCGLLVFACLLACLLLIVNRILVTSLYTVLLPPSFDFPKLRTVLLFVAMIALLFPEWWLFDWASERIRSWYPSVDPPDSRRRR